MKGFKTQHGSLKDQVFQFLYPAIKKRQQKKPLAEYHAFKDAKLAETKLNTKAVLSTIC